MPLYPALATLAGVLMLVSGCALQPTVAGKSAARDMDDVSDCVARLGRHAGTFSEALQGPHFSLVNWNIRKGKHADADDATLRTQVSRPT